MSMRQLLWFFSILQVKICELFDDINQFNEFVYSFQQGNSIHHYQTKILAVERNSYTESAAMTSEGGTKSSFSPFLIFLRATRPLSPTSTLCIAIFCSGKPDSDSHRCRADAFSSESTSQPQVIFWAFVVSFAVEIVEHLMVVMLLLCFLLNLLWKLSLWVVPFLTFDVFRLWENEGMSVILGRKMEASAMVEEERKSGNLIWAWLRKIGQ